MKQGEYALGWLGAARGSVVAILECGAELGAGVGLHFLARAGAAVAGACACRCCKLPVEPLLVATITCRHQDLDRS